MNNVIPQFRDAIHAAGLEPPDVIEAGKLYRFPGIGKRNGNTAGWCKLFDDGLGGCFGDWSSGFSENWQAKRDKPFSDSERSAFMQRVNEARTQAEAERQVKYTEAAGKAVAIWKAAEPANTGHPYLDRKAIKANGTRLYKDALVIPMRDGGELCSLQFIAKDGNKKFLSGGRVSGCYFSIGNTTGAEALCIAEGFATGATIHQATGYPVVVAFNAGNLEHVAVAMRKKFPSLNLVICADDDWKTQGNPGITKAEAAAKLIGAKVALPVFGDARTEGMTDFNDMAELVGLDAVAKAIKGAVLISDWPEPQPLIASYAPESYPLDSLPSTVRSAVEEVQGFVKAPIPMVASSALAALSLAIQAHVDVKRAEKLTGPTGLFLLTIADSGERKSTCDGFFTKAIRDYEAEQAEAAKPVQKRYVADMETWAAECGGIKDKIRQLAKNGKPRLKEQEELRNLKKPEPPKIPRLMYMEATPEALAYELAKRWPSGGVVSAEAGIVFGSHGMGKDSVMRNLALLNQLWDGTSLTIDRRTSESFTVRGARLTIALQVQEPTLREFFSKSGALARGTGFMARFLVAWPASTQGRRPFTEAPANWPALKNFNKRLEEILNQPAPIDDDGALTPAMLSLSPEAKRAWINFHDEIEKELASGGELYDVRDVASKTADNAVRLAALFQMFEHGTGAVSLACFESASRITLWHLLESRRFFSEMSLPEEQADSARLDSWLIEYCKREKVNLVGKNFALQHGPLRKKDRLDAAIWALVDLDRVRLESKDGKRKILELNPALLDFATAIPAIPAIPATGEAILI